MNNKGQTLVVFVIILPIILIMLTLVIDLGLLYIEKRNIDNNVYDSVLYYLENIEEDNIKDKTYKLLNKNIKDRNIFIKKKNKYIKITFSKKRKRKYSIITQNTNIKIKYKGLKEDKKIIKG